MVCSLLDRLVIARILIGLIAIEVVTSLILIPMDAMSAGVSTVALAVFGSVYSWMYRQTAYRPGMA
jgi:uncharacterized membrane protein